MKIAFNPLPSDCIHLAVNSQTEAALGVTVSCDASKKTGQGSRGAEEQGSRGAELTAFILFSEDAI